LPQALWFAQVPQSEMVFGAAHDPALDPPAPLDPPVDEPDDDEPEDDDEDVCVPVEPALAAPVPVP
jgi:hypothetical protein